MSVKQPSIKSHHLRRTHLLPVESRQHLKLFLNNALTLDKAYVIEPMALFGTSATTPA